MKYFFILAILAITIMPSSAQNNIRPLPQLINKEDPGWRFVKEWIDSAKNKVEILPADTARANEALYQIQVTTRSPMGAIVYMTGGLLVDNGWIRILGSGSARLNRTLPGWNFNKSITGNGKAPPFLLIADDAIGGFFILNGGALGKDLGKVYYFAPDNLEYEPLDLTYSEFLVFCFNHDLDKFYEGYRWKDWKTDVANLPGDQVFNFVLPLWTKEGKNIEKGSRRAVPIEEQYSLNISFRKQLGIGK